MEGEHGGTKPLSCADCTEKFDNQYEYDIHTWSLAHHTHISKTKGKKKVVHHCGLCNVTCGSIQVYATHINGKKHGFKMKQYSKEHNKHKDSSRRNSKTSSPKNDNQKADIDSGNFSNSKTWQSHQRPPPWQNYQRHRWHHEQIRFQSPGPRFHHERSNQRGPHGPWSENRPGWIPNLRGRYPPQQHPNFDQSFPQGNNQKMGRWEGPPLDRELNIHHQKQSRWGPPISEENYHTNPHIGIVNQGWLKSNSGHASSTGMMFKSPENVRPGWNEPLINERPEPKRLPHDVPGTKKAKADSHANEKNDNSDSDLASCREDNLTISMKANKIIDDILGKIGLSHESYILDKNIVNKKDCNSREVDRKDDQNYRSCHVKKGVVPRRIAAVSSSNKITNVKSKFSMGRGKLISTSKSSALKNPAPGGNKTVGSMLTKTKTMDVMVARGKIPPRVASKSKMPTKWSLNKDEKSVKKLKLSTQSRPVAPPKENLLKLVNQPRSRQERLKIDKIIQAYNSKVAKQRPKLDLGEQLTEHEVVNIDWEGEAKLDELPLEIQKEIELLMQDSEMLVMSDNNTDQEILSPDPVQINTGFPVLNTNMATPHNNTSDRVALINPEMIKIENKQNTDTVVMIDSDVEESAQGNEVLNEDENITDHMEMADQPEITEMDSDMKVIEIVPIDEMENNQHENGAFLSSSASVPNMINLVDEENNLGKISVDNKTGLHETHNPSEIDVSEGNEEQTENKTLVSNQDIFQATNLPVSEDVRTVDSSKRRISTECTTNSTSDKDSGLGPPQPKRAKTNNNNQPTAPGQTKDCVDQVLAISLQEEEIHRQLAETMMSIQHLHNVLAQTNAELQRKLHQRSQLLQEEANLRTQRMEILKGAVADRDLNHDTVGNDCIQLPDTTTPTGEDKGSSQLGSKNTSPTSSSNLPVPPVTTDSRMQHAEDSSSPNPITMHYMGTLDASSSDSITILQQLANNMNKPSLKSPPYMFLEEGSMIEVSSHSESELLPINANTVRNRTMSEESEFKSPESVKLKKTVKKGTRERKNTGSDISETVTSITSEDTCTSSEDEVSSSRRRRRRASVIKKEPINKPPSKKKLSSGCSSTNDSSTDSSKRKKLKSRKQRESRRSPKSEVLAESSYDDEAVSTTSPNEKKKKKRGKGDQQAALKEVKSGAESNNEVASEKKYVLSREEHNIMERTTRKTSETPENHSRRLKMDQNKVEEMRKSWMKFKQNAPCKKAESIVKYMGHTGTVYQLVAYEHWLLSCSEDCTVKAFDLKTQKCVRTFARHTKGVRSLIITNAGGLGARLFTGSFDCLLVCHDFETGDFITQVDMEHRIHDFEEAWNKLYIGLANGDLVAWDLKKNKVTSKFSCGYNPVRCIASGREGTRRLLAVSCVDGTLTLRDASNNLLLRQLSGHTKSPMCLQVVDSVVYSGAADKTVMIHNLYTGELNHQLTLKSIVSGMCIEGDMLIVASYDGLVRCYSTKNYELVQQYYGANNMVTAVLVYDGMLYSGDRDGTIEAVELDLGTRWQCQFGRCVAIFGLRSHLEKHILVEHVTENPSGLKCMWSGCHVFIPSQDKDKLAGAHYASHLDDLYKQMQRDNEDTAASDEESSSVSS